MGIHHSLENLVTSQNISVRQFRELSSALGRLLRGGNGVYLQAEERSQERITWRLSEHETFLSVTYRRIST